MPTQRDQGPVQPLKGWMSSTIGPGVLSIKQGKIQQSQIVDNLLEGQCICDAGDGTVFILSGEKSVEVPHHCPDTVRKYADEPDFVEEGGLKRVTVGPINIGDSEAASVCFSSQDNCERESATPILNALEEGGIPSC